MFNDILDRRPMVFLGGTVNDSTWRDEIIPKLKIKYFNPVVDDWTPEHQEKEKEMRQKADIVLYVITPKMTGVYSVAEVVDDSNKRPSKTVFCFLEKDGDKEFDQSQIGSLNAVGEMVKRNGGTWVNNLDEVVRILNLANHLEFGR